MSRKLIHVIRRLAVLHDLEATDAQLLGRFAAQRDEAAFETLVRRHGALVMGVCRRVLQNHHDAEDAFQATFLVLARKAQAIVPREMLPNWLFGVALTTARRAKVMNAKRRTREKQVVTMPEPVTTDRDPWSDTQAVLDEELRRLPEKYRVAVLLCDLEGLSHKQAARALGWPIGTLSGRLSRARTMLAQRLRRRGIGLSLAALTAGLSQTSLAPVSAEIVVSTVKFANAGATGAVAALAEGVLKAMLLTKIKIGTGLLMLVLAMAAMSVGALKHAATASAPDTSQDARAKPAPPPEAPRALRCFGLLEKINRENNTLTAITLKGAGAHDVAAILPFYAKRSEGLEKANLPALVNIPLAKGVKVTEDGNEMKVADLQEKQVVLLDLGIGHGGLEITAIKIMDSGRLKARRLIFYRFRYLNAKEAERVLVEAFGRDRGLIITADPINNAVLLSGSDLDIRSAVKILEAIDAPIGQKEAFQRELGRLQGTWICVGYWSAGKREPDEKVQSKKLGLLINGSELAITNGVGKMQGTFKIAIIWRQIRTNANNEVLSKTMDWLLTENGKAVVLRVIYEHDGDQLTVIDGEEERPPRAVSPKDMKTGEKMYVFKRLEH